METAPPWFTGQLLLALPGIGDPRFEHSVIAMISHDESGAMGIGIADPIDGMTVGAVLDQLDIAHEDDPLDTPVFLGGPVEQTRGFVLHSTDYVDDATLRVGDTVGLTATIDILKDIAAGSGPRRSILALGYAGWGPGQLDAELQANAWLTVPADEELIFDDALNDKWERSLHKIGVDTAFLTGEAGHA